MLDPSSPIFEQTRMVEPGEIDDMNHVNNVVYVKWANDIAEQHWLQRAPKHLRETCDWVMLKHCIEYKKSAVLGDKILVQTQVGRATNVRYERFVVIKQADTGVVLAQTTADWCAVDKKGKPMGISRELRNIFEIA
ncbi:acyl-CoA thioesterase [Nonlabens xiamenensis]|uniref:acyl-CoA thioesterase n=1 Tax=Nonlabens xiamenensis TaxID=2341043 RepID=UPI000F6114E6|nr:acyl-CoA thioesterase [Nonlabens xiamenensis]